MILIALGANLPHPEYGDPVNTLAEAVRRLGETLTILRRSSWYRTAPVPPSDQPWFANAVIAVETALPSADLLELLHKVEAEIGRVRRQRWEARVLDLDLLTYHDQVTANLDQESGPVLPHPRLQERGFVLAPIAEIAPEWRHPVSKKGARELLEILPGEQTFDVILATDPPA